MANGNNKKKVSVKDALTLVISILVIIGMVALIIVGSTGGCFSEEEIQNNADNMMADIPPEPAELENLKIYTEEEIPTGKPIVTVEMENGESFKMELYPDIAPQTVANFVTLAESGFYNGLGFHRIVEGFMAQGGDPEGTGMGGSEFNIVGEFASNDYPENTLLHTRGVVSMARSDSPDSASSQFFICYDDASLLDGNYAAFGRVIEGMETVDGFLEIERVMGSDGELSSPVEPIIMKSVTVER